MPNRKYYHQESIASSTNNTITAASKVSFSFTPENNSRYIFIWSAQVQNSSSNTRDIVVAVTTTVGATVTNISNCNTVVQDTTDWLPISGTGVQSFGVSPGAVTVSMTFRAETAGDSCSIREARIIAIRLETDDEYVENIATQTNTTITLATATTLSWTPPSPGNYLLLASLEYNFSSTGGEVVFNVGHTQGGVTNTYLNARVRPRDSTNYPSSFHAIYLKSISGAQTATITWARSSTATGTASVRKAKICAIRLDSFIKVIQAANRTTLTSTSTAYSIAAQTGLTAVQNKAHLILACCTREHRSTSNSALTRITNNAGTVVVTTSSQEGFTTTTGVDVPCGVWGQMLLTTPAAGNENWKIEYASEASGTTTIADQIQIFAIQLSGVQSYPSMNGVTQRFI